MCSHVPHILRSQPGAGRCGWAAMLFRSGFFGVFGGDSGGWSYLVGAFGGVRICSGLFGFVREVVEGLTVVSFVNFCHGLVSVGQAVVAGGEDVSAGLRGERHGMALLFCGKSSRSWGERGCVVGDSWGMGAGGVSGAWRWLGASHPPPNLPPGRGEGLNWGGGGMGVSGILGGCVWGGGVGEV